MPVIAFSDKSEEIWKARGWVFEQLLEDTLSHSEPNPEMTSTLERSQAVGGLNLDLLDSKLASTIVKAFSQEITGLLAGDTHSGLMAKPYGDELALKQYKASLRELLRILDAKAEIQTRFNS